nr:hypothetical protein [Tanacetum cinerariifolium]
TLLTQKLLEILLLSIEEEDRRRILASERRLRQEVRSSLYVGQQLLEDGIDPYVVSRSLKCNPGEQVRIGVSHLYIPLNVIVNADLGVTEMNNVFIEQHVRNSFGLSALPLWAMVNYQMGLTAGPCI